MSKEKDLKEQRRDGECNIADFYKIKILEDCGDEVIELWDGDAKVFEWRNNANIDYPEDLSWGRMIGQLFKEAFTLGYYRGKYERTA